MAGSHFLFFILAFLYVLSVDFRAYALYPTSDLYDQGPVQFDDHGQLWYAVDLSTRTAYLALRVNDTEVLNTDASQTWIGLGISEPTSGSMVGADVITAEYSSDISCSVTDRFVPFAAFPLGESTPDSPSVFPVKDDCQDDGSWELVRCERDIENGVMILEVSRSLDAHDDQDRDIVKGLNSIIYAYGNNFGYHQSKRGALKVVLYEDGTTSSEKPITAVPVLPEDVDGLFEVRNTNYTVPSNMTTTYACTSKRFDLGDKSQRMIVAVEPIIDAPIDMVHHFILLVCSGEAYADLTKETNSCMGFNGIPGPFGNSQAKCSTYVYGYAKGSTRVVLPREAGILMNEARQFLIVETHFDNSELVEGNIDKSGVRVYYTDTMRDNEAGSLQIGDGFISKFGEVVKSGFEYENTCPSECTSKFSTNINVYASLLHMHTTGKEIYTNVFAKNGTFLRNMNKMGKMFDPTLVIKPGEKLQTTCIYDTSKRPKTTFGIETTQEMCVDFISYYPVQRDPVTGDEINFCTPMRDGEKIITMCGDNSNLNGATIIPGPNPNFEDTVGAPTTFGNGPGTCPIADALAPTKTPVPSTALLESEAMGPEPNSEAAPIPTSSITPLTTESELESESESDDSLGSVVTEQEPTSSGNDESNENTCFPASATVQLKNGSVKRMSDIALGDEVQIGKDAFSTVFMFTHRDNEAQSRFVQITVSDRVRVSLTDSHFIYANGELVMARDVRIGDNLRLGDGNTSIVQKIERRLDRGLFNPQTMQGDIVVGGIVTSTYTRAVMPSSAHALLSPLRWAYEVFGIDPSGLVL